MNRHAQGIPNDLYSPDYADILSLYILVNRNLALRDISEIVLMTNNSAYKICLKGGLACAAIVKSQ